MSEYLYAYLDDLLGLQSGAADRHNHNGVLGAVREKFVAQVLTERVPNIKERIHTGELTCNAGDLGQNDILIRRPNTLNTELGGQIRIPATECASIIEIKSNAKATEVTKFDQKSSSIKTDNPDAICGIVCYKLNCRKETILKRMGYYFDDDQEVFLPNLSGNKQYDSLDFIFCLDEEYEETNTNSYKKSFFIKKGLSGDYELFLDPPYMEYFLMAVNAVANPAG